MKSAYLEPSWEAGRAFARRNIKSGLVMLNLLRFRGVADYSATPELTPTKPITGAEAYERYVAYTLPLLRKSGGDLLFVGEGGPLLIGPEEDQWDRALLIRQKSTDAFLAFAANKAYLAGIGHRTAALSDSRLLPLVELQR
jgi:uncharacterized protein (DUF1330 family)